MDYGWRILLQGKKRKITTSECPPNSSFPENSDIRIPNSHVPDEISRSSKYSLFLHKILYFPYLISNLSKIEWQYYRVTWLGVP